MLCTVVHVWWIVNNLCTKNMFKMTTNDPSYCRHHSCYIGHEQGMYIAVMDRTAIYWDVHVMGNCGSVTTVNMCAQMDVMTVGGLASLVFTYQT